jgi:Flp pilus assembly protein CpaB
MRASTLFALTVAILLGLATAVTLKVTGFFDKPVTAVAPPPAKKVDVLILVPQRNLFKGNLIDPPWVTTRALREDELKHYEAHKEEYLPATPAAVTFRVAAKNLEADKPLLRSDLEDFNQPQKVTERLMPNMRAINVSAMKDESAGGLIQVGEWVDVYLTTQIARTEMEPITKTAPIAHNLRVIAKRNGLFQIIAPLPDDKPVHFTLEANPYRTALIEFCKTKGTLTLVPVPAAEQKALEEARKAALVEVDQGFQQVSYKAPFPANSVEYQDEDARIDGIIKGDMYLGTSDLVRIFGIKTTPPPVAPTRIIEIKGNVYVGTSSFGPDDVPLDPPGRAPNAAAAASARAQVQELIFQSPDAVPKKCKTCGAGKPKQ